MMSEEQIRAVAAKPPVSDKGAVGTATLCTLLLILDELRAAKSAPVAAEPFVGPPSPVEPTPAPKGSTKTDKAKPADEPAPEPVAKPKPKRRRSRKTRKE